MFSGSRYRNRNECEECRSSKTSYLRPNSGSTKTFIPSSHVQNITLYCVHLLDSPALNEQPDLTITWFQSAPFIDKLDFIFVRALNEERGKGLVKYILGVRLYIDSQSRVSIGNYKVLEYETQRSPPGVMNLFIQNLCKKFEGRRVKV